MVERNSDQLLLCKLCPVETKDKFCVANCIGCKDLFCFVHLMEHRQQLSDQFDQLIKQHTDINEHSLTEVNIRQHLEYIDKWESEIIQLIQQHTKDVKEKILCISNVYKNELRQRYTNLGKDLSDKRVLNAIIEGDLKEISKQIEQLDKDIKNVNKVLHQIAVKELNDVAEKCNKPVNTT
ncbi:unnamed protein product, partial [Rotaria magnacalcarata]